MNRAEREWRIRERAYAIWQSEGCPEGRHQDHWRQACEAVDREASDRRESNTGRFDPTSDAMLSGTPGAGFNTRGGSFGSGEGVVHDAPDAPSDVELNERS